jgi:hypothetical protein
MKSLSLAGKLNVIRHTYAEHQFNFCKELDFAGLTVSFIFKNKDDIKECGKIATPLRASKLNNTLCASNS